MESPPVASSPPTSPTDLPEKEEDDEELSSQSFLGRSDIGISGSCPVSSEPPSTTEEVSTSPTTPLNNEVDDEEIAAEIKTPLETIREESFDLSSSAHHPVALSTALVDDAKSAAENENSVLVEEDEKSSSPDDNVDVINDDNDQDVPTKSHIRESIDIESSKPNSAHQREGLTNAALGAVADSSESGDDPSLREVGETKGPTSSSSNDIDNKNDEMAHGSSSPLGGEISSSSQDKNDDAKDEMLLMADENSAPVQNGDQPSETGLEEEPITDNEDAGIPPREENPESSTTDAPVVDGVEDNAEESQNMMIDTPPQQDSKEALGVINLSSDDGTLAVSDTANVSDADQTPICVDENQGVEEESDKNKKSDVADDDEVFNSDGEQPEVGQPVEEVGVGDDAEKTESNQLQQSPSALTTESSVDREDTDIATPTDFSAGEEKESLNLEELKKFASNFEEESQEFGELDKDIIMDPAVTTPEGGVVEPEIVKTVAPVVNQPSSQESITSAETASSGDAGVLQVEIKSSEPASPAPAEGGDANKPASPEGGATEAKDAAIESPAPPTEQKSSEETVVANEQAKTPEVTSPTPAEEKAVAETPTSSPAPATPESATSPAPEAVGTPASEEAKSPEPPVPILRPGSGESQPASEEKPAEQVVSPTPSEEKPAEAVTSPTPSEEKPAEQVVSPTPSEEKPAETVTSPPPAETPTSPEPVTAESPKSSEPAPAETPTSPEPVTAESPKRPEPVSAESPKSPEPAPAESPKSPEAVPTSPEPVSTESPKSPEPEKAPEAVSSPAPTESPQAASPTSEIQKTEASPIASPPPVATTPEETATSPTPTSEPKSETPTTTQETAVPNNSAPTSPEPSSTTTITTTNQPEKKRIKQREKAIAIGTVVDQEKRKESVEPEKQDKPVVKRRLPQVSYNKLLRYYFSCQGKTLTLAAQAEVASSISRSIPRFTSFCVVTSRALAEIGVVLQPTSIARISMDEMEKEIENEMMNTAAIKIQAGFRGFQTRKSLVGVKCYCWLNPSGESVVPEKCLNTNTATIAGAEASEKEVVAVVPVATAASARFTPETLAKDAESIAFSSAIHASRGGKPPLSCLRSRSYPGSHEEEHPLLEFDEGDEDLLYHPEPEIDLELDPDYINRAATKIQANFRGYRVRKSFKRPAGKEHNGDKSLLKSQKLAEADKEAEERAKVELMNGCNNVMKMNYAQKTLMLQLIQASFRSYKERQKFHRKKKQPSQSKPAYGLLDKKRLAKCADEVSSADAHQPSLSQELEEIKKVNEAATKIQAVFRGYKVRSKMPRSSMINEQEQFIDE
ncbi:Neurofilament heavy polypeptide [Orchesella cincta]|uniref:Neurofilament heavy polypeptide n=1 Tax=Orchesella cincta TaxID=48709 RepID=A0A1D2MUC5_ORCCI|nr:Neurofilament heavy polypeptide [Orchesella cincta]